MRIGPDALIGSLFDAVADDAAFADLPRRVVEVGEGFSTTIWVHASQSARSVATYGFPGEAAKAYTEYFWRHDLWANSSEAALSEDVVNLDEYVRPDELARSEIYNDLLRPTGDIFHCLGFGGDLGGGERLLFSLHRARTQADFEPELLASLQVLKPLFIHLFNARRRAAEGRGRIAQDLLDADPDAVFVVGRTGFVLYANAAAQRVTAAAPVVLRFGRLAAAVPADIPVLARAVSWACTGRGGSVAPLQGCAPGRFRVEVDGLPGDGGLACVRMRDLEARMRAKLDQARRVYALTAAECDLAGALVRGLSVGEHALARGVALTTVRTQVRALFAKVGVQRQADLIQALQGARRG